MTKECIGCGGCRSVTLQGQPYMLAGDGVKVGGKAPDFTAVANDLSSFKLSSYLGKTVVIASVPSLDTPVCDTEARRFNQEASKLDENVRILVVSMDLPFAQKRWCGDAGVERVKTVSDHRSARFGNAYGVLIPDLGLLARAVFVVDPKGVVKYVEIVNEIADEPNYDAVLDAVKKLL